jgi:putative MATE family efflux protein
MTVIAKKPTYVGMDLTVGSIPKKLILFGLPMLVGSALQTGYSLVNAFWVGKYLGTNALAAVTVSFPAIFVLIAIGAGLTLASNILVAQYVGARQIDQVKNVVQTSVALISVLGLIFLAAGLYFADHLLRLTNTPADVFPIALSYVRVFFWTLPLGFSIFLISALLRGIGDSKTPLYFQAASLALNTVLDPCLMFGAVGFPKLGLNGTAFASIISQTAAVIGLMVYIPRYRPAVSPNWRRLRINRHTAWLLIRIGFPSMIQQSVVSVSMLFIVTFVSAFGADADAAFGAALRIDQVAFLPALTIGIAVSTLSGQNIGALQYQRVREVFRWGLMISGGISLAISILTMSFPYPFLRIFLNDPRVIEIGVGYLRIVGVTYTLYAVMFVSNGVINGSGHTVPSTLITMINLWGVRVPLASLLPRYTHSIKGIWIAMTVSVATGMVISLLYYFSGRWKQPVIKKPHPTPGL